MGSISCCIASFAQEGISPLHLFNTGLNMGFLDGHFANRTASDQYGVWAANASAEWIASWTPGFVAPIVPDIDNPFTANNQYVAYLITRPAPCLEPYFQAKLTIYRTAELLGRSIVHTGNPVLGVSQS
jgi:prepilin-type processing-associated H-X9-DG protein